MAKIFTSVMMIWVTYRAVSAKMGSAKFSTKSAAEQQNGLSYKRVGSSYSGRGRSISQLQCAKVCMNEDNCKSVYVDGEACVFGFDDVTAFEEGELVIPDPNQVLRVKGKHIQCCLC